MDESDKVDVVDKLSVAEFTNVDVNVDVTSDDVVVSDATDGSEGAIG